MVTTYFGGLVYSSRVYSMTLCVYTVPYIYIHIYIWCMPVVRHPHMWLTLVHLTFAVTSNHMSLLFINVCSLLIYHVVPCYCFVSSLLCYLSFSNCSCLHMMWYICCHIYLTCGVSTQWTCRHIFFKCASFESGSDGDIVYLCCGLYLPFTNVCRYHIV